MEVDGIVSTYRLYDIHRPIFQLMEDLPHLDPMDLYSWCEGDPIVRFTADGLKVE